MARLSWQNDPHGCLDDWLNEQVGEAMHATHVDEHEAYPQKDCEWCEAEREAEEMEAARVRVDEESGYCQKCGERLYHRCECKEKP